MPGQEFEVPPHDLPPPGGMNQVEVDGEKILLVHDGKTLHAVGARCPHAGAPLAEGIRHGNRIVCPWHKAAFCIHTGKLLDPPAVDPIPSYPLTQRQGRTLLTKPPTEPGNTPPTPDHRTFVIAGAGAAGALAAQTLRENGFTGRILLLDDANRVPYDRTILSKYALSGEKGAEKSPLQPQSFYDDMRIERRKATIRHVDPRARTITCNDGKVLAYDAALLATGSTAIQASLPGATLPEVFTLRSRADADAILARAEQSRRAVVIGAGFIGMEVAAALRERGLGVTVVTPDAAPFEKQLGPEIGGAFVTLHERRGVAFRLRATATAILGDTKVEAVLLEGGERLDADLVVIGLGAKPATAYAQGLTQDKHGALAVDSHLRVADHLYAAGDIAGFPYRGNPIRVEHWRVAQQQGRIAALNMLGHDTPYDAIPYFWTIHFMKRLDYVGHATKWDDLVIHGDLAEADFLAYYVTAGTVTAAAGLGRDQDMAALIELFATSDWRPEDLGEHPATRRFPLPQREG